MASRYSPTDLREIEINRVAKIARASTSNNARDSYDHSEENETVGERSPRHRDLYHSCFPQLVRNRQPVDICDTERNALTMSACNNAKEKEEMNDINLIKGRLLREDGKARMIGNRLGDRRIKDSNCASAKVEPGNFQKAKYKEKHQKLQEILYTYQDDSSLLQNLRRALDVPVTSLQWIRRPPQQFWPNLWQTIVKDRIVNEPNVVAQPNIDGNDSTDDEELKGDSLDTQSNNAGRRGQISGLTSKHCSPEDKGSQSKLKKRKNKKQKSSKDRDGGGEAFAQYNEVIYPPYCLDSKESNSAGIQTSTNQRRPSPPNSSLCTFVHSIMAESDTDDFVDHPEMEFACASRNKSVPLKWSQPGDNIPGDVKRECHMKGYDILRKIWRGKIREHSYLYMADNKRNFQYSPVEITAIRRPYANFTSSAMNTRTSRDHAKNNANNLPPHRNLIMLLHRFYTTEWVYTITDHCQWPSLEHLIESTGPSLSGDSGEKKGLTENACRTVFRQVCAGMGHLHQHKILHGDLNCHNILVTDKLKVKLTGYGPTCQRMINPQLKIKGRVKLHGDPYDIYTPPEIMSRGDMWTNACDVWCIGVTLLHMILGEIPDEINAAVRLSGTMRNLEKISLASVGYQLSLLIDKILQPRPALRPNVSTLAEHTWLSDGTDLAAAVRQKATKSDPMRTDGHTFPLPKRLQRQRNRTPDAFYNENDEEDGDFSEEETEVEDLKFTNEDDHGSEEEIVEDQHSDSGNAAFEKQMNSTEIPAEEPSTSTKIMENSDILLSKNTCKDDFGSNREEGLRFADNQPEADADYNDDTEHEELLALCDRLEFQGSLSGSQKDGPSLFEIIDEYESVKSARKLKAPMSSAFKNEACANQGLVCKTIQSGSEYLTNLTGRTLKRLSLPTTKSEGLDVSHLLEVKQLVDGSNPVLNVDNDAQNKFVIDDEEVALQEIENMIRREEKKLCSPANQSP